MKEIILAITLLFFTLCFTTKTLAQKVMPISFTYSFKNKNDPDTIILFINNQSQKTFYYSISLAAYINNDWKPLISDINSLGTNEFVALKPINAKNKVIKEVSKKRIFLLYGYQEITKIRFGVMFYKKRDFNTKGEIIYTPPL